MANKTLNNVKINMTLKSTNTRAQLSTSSEDLAVQMGKINKWYESLVPTGGESGNILGWNSDGTAKWVTVAPSANKLNVASAVGGTTQPVYFKADGTPEAISFTIGKSVPANAVFTDQNVKSTLLAQSTAEVSYRPTFITGATTGGVYIIDSYKVNHTPGTTSAVGNTRLVLGNATASGTANNEEGQIKLYSPGTAFHTIKGTTISSEAVHVFPSTGGTILNTGTTSYTQTSSSSATGAYEIGKIKINGTTTTIYGKDTGTTYTASDGIKIESTVIKHTNAIGEQTSAVFKKITYDAQGHITGTANVAASDIPALNYVPNTQAGVNAAINLLGTGSSTPTDADYYISQYVGGGTTTTTYHRRPMSALWAYIKGKGDLIYAPLNHTHTLSIAADSGTNQLTLSANTKYKLTAGGSTFIFTTPTDNDTKVTSSANHYTPATESGSDKSASASGATAAWSIDVVKGVTLNTDGKGHVTGISVTSGKIPANPVPSNNVTGGGTSGYLTKWNGANTITNGPQLGSSTTTFLRNDGTWATPTDTDTKVKVASNTTSKAYLIGTTTAPAGTAVEGVGDVNVYMSATDHYLTAPGFSTTATNKGYYAYDSTSTRYALIFDNGSNLWIGTDMSVHYPHNGQTFISTGWTGTLPTSEGTLTGYDTIRISVPKYTVPSGSTTGTWNHTNYYALHTGNTSFTRTLSSGTKIGTIKINGTSTDLYCETNINTDTKVTQSQTTTEEFRPVLFGATHNTNPESLEGTITDASYVTKRIFAQPATGNLYLYSTSGDSPALVFRRGTMIDSYNDWKIYNSGGHLYFAMSTANASSETWTNKVYINGSTGKLYVGGTAVSVEGHTHNYAGSSSAGGAATNINTTVTPGTSPTHTNYGLLFVENPDTSGSNAARKSNDIRVLQLDGTTDTPGYARIVLGNATASGTAGNKNGQIALYTDLGGAHIIDTTASTATLTHTLPAATGTILNTGTTSFTQILSSGTKIGTIKINGTSTDIYCETNTNTDTKVNVTLATTTKAYLLGTSTTPTATAQAVTSLADTGVYLDTTAGGLCATNVKASSTICANTACSNSAGGIALYGTDPLAYGIMFRGTTNSGKHGYVQSDWATYFTMNEGGTTRGWVFKRQTTGPIASISGAGHAVFNGSVTVGGNSTNTSGCRMEYNSTTQTLDFVFA